MRYFCLLLALGSIALIVPSAQAREVTELRDQIRDGVKRTDKDLGNVIQRDKLNEQQRGRYDAAVKDLEGLSEVIAAKDGKWQAERERLVRAVDNIDFLQKNAPLADADRQVIGIDLYTLRTILDSWKPEPPQQR